MRTHTSYRPTSSSTSNYNKRATLLKINAAGDAIPTGASDAFVSSPAGYSMSTVDTKATSSPPELKLIRKSRPEEPKPIDVIARGRDIGTAPVQEQNRVMPRSSSDNIEELSMSEINQVNL